MLGHACQVLCEYLLLHAGVGADTLSALPAWLPSFGSTSTSSPVMTLSTATLPTTTATPLVHPLEGKSVANIILPQKLILKIVELEYIEMADLVPESWRLQEEEQGRCCHQARRLPRKGPVTDILLWVECYASLVAVLSTRYPAAVPELMAYQITILKASKSFVGEGWVTYDTYYRHKAAATKSLRWGEVDFNLYNETFAGRARAVPRCKHCSSEHHSSDECMYAPDVLTPGRAAPLRNDTKCLLFNSNSGNKCRYKNCKFDHRCVRCGGSHPVATCYRSRSPGERQRQPRSPHDRTGKV